MRTLIFCILFFPLRFAGADFFCCFVKINFQIPNVSFIFVSSFTTKAKVMAHTIVPSEKTTLVYSDPKESGEYEYIETPLVTILDENRNVFVSYVTCKEAYSILRCLESEDAPVINNSGISLW